MFFIETEARYRLFYLDLTYLMLAADRTLLCFELGRVNLLIEIIGKSLGDIGISLLFGVIFYVSEYTLQCGDFKVVISLKGLLKILTLQLI